MSPRVFTESPMTMPKWNIVHTQMDASAATMEMMISIFTMLYKNIRTPIWNRGCAVRVWGLKFGVWGLGLSFRVKGYGLRISV